jgi:hypothetical protein
VLDEIEALRSEIERIKDGQVIVVFYDKLDPVMKVLDCAVGIKNVKLNQPILTR